MLDPIQNQALRLCLGAFRTSPVESLQVEANEPSLAFRRNWLAVLYALKIRSNPNNPTYDLIFNPQYTQIFERKTKAIPTFGIRVEHQLSGMTINLSTIAINRMSKVPPWIVKLPKVIFAMQVNKKSSINPELHKQYFNELLGQYLNFTHIYTDGSKEGPHVAAAMVYKRTSVQCRLPDNSSIFSAEAKAILLALAFIESFHSSKFIIFSDSLSCLQAIHCTKWTNPFIQAILEKCHFLSLAHKEVNFFWLPSHVGISGNERADNAAKSALQLQITDCKIPYSDYKQMVSEYYINVWQTHWNNVAFNKLQPIKGTIGDTLLKNVSKRRDELVLHRARIGHTHLTHCFLLKDEDQPECIPCQCPFSVKHILIECPDFTISRDKYYRVSSLKELFNQTSLLKIIEFLKEIQLYHKF